MTESTPKSDDKVMAAVATLPLVGLIIYYAMPDASAIVKHYAKQSNAVLALSVVSFIISMILSFIIPVIGSCIGFVISIVPTVAWIMLLIKALNNVADYKLPVVGEYFDKLIK